MVATTFIVLFYLLGILVSMALIAIEVQKDMLQRGMAFNYWDCFDAVVKSPHATVLTSWLFVATYTVWSLKKRK